MLELYHNPYAICAYKVRIALEEKKLAWTSRVVRDVRNPEYLRLNPSGYVPTLVHDGRVLVESRIISEYIADAFPEGVRLLPEDPHQRYLARYWSKQVDDSLHLSVFVLTFNAFYRDHFLSLSEPDLQKTLARDPLKRQVTIDLLRDGYDAQWVGHAIRRFERLAAELEDALDGSKWLAGNDFSLADADLGAYAHRLGELGLEALWSRSPNVLRWFDQFAARPSYRLAVLEWLDEEYLERTARSASRTREALNALATQDVHPPQHNRALR